MELLLISSVAVIAIVSMSVVTFKTVRIILSHNINLINKITFKPEKDC